MSSDNIVGTSTAVEPKSELQSFDIRFERQIVAREGQACKYHDHSSNGSSPLACPLASLICTSAVFDLEQRLTAESLKNALSYQTDDNAFDPVNVLLSERTVKDVISTGEPLGLAVGFRVEELLATLSFRPIFLTLSTSQGITSYWGFLMLLDKLCRSPHKICAAIITYSQETIVCFKFTLAVDLPETYLLFDPHARPNHPSGPGFMLNNSKDAIASYLSHLCASIKQVTERTYFGSHLFSVHIIIARNNYHDYNIYLPASDSGSREEESPASRLENQRFSVAETDHFSVSNPLPELPVSRLPSQRFSFVEAGHSIISNPFPELSSHPPGGIPSFWQPETDFGRELLLELDSIAPPVFLPSFECGICFEEHEVRKGVMIASCEHPFCRDCLLGHVKTKLTERQYPIRCPTCSAERGRLDPGTVDQRAIAQLSISEHGLDKFEELQLLVHSVKLTCPKCKETMFVLRSDYLDQKFIICPLPKCRHEFCKTCGKRIWAASSRSRHACTNDAKLDRLVRKQGWRYCPGCHIPVQKESGCNHMTCVGCYTHFCYRCGKAIASPSEGQDIGIAVTTHYSSCVQYEPIPIRRIRNCTIQ